MGAQPEPEKETLYQINTGGAWKVFHITTDNYPLIAGRTGLMIQINTPYPPADLYLSPSNDPFGYEIHLSNYTDPPPNNAINLPINYYVLWNDGYGAWARIIADVE